MLISIQLLPVPQKWVTNYEVDLVLVNMDICGPGSVVSIATGYGLDSPGIESRWGQDFPHLGPTQLPVQWVPGLSRV